ncbi:MAG TPA: hypothetical protein VF892_25565 [Pseudonocardiaceae bacterium]
MFKAFIVAVAVLAGIVCAGVIGAAETGQTHTAAQTLDCPADMHWASLC